MVIAHFVPHEIDIVFRYHYAKGDGRDSLRTRTPFGGWIPEVTDSGRGEEYQSLYLVYIVKFNIDILRSN